ncbi:shikimate dehydrogenase [Sphingobacterium sp. UT-1RO-CII-1]|uniref:shikimate dehydrogenase family protein n=1 Tax=Sphingobacterium sp. UT-1RO-CII-1 TaxID=2995225 RepID=UPI00227CBCBD|nr:shikimate dehydrogenase [Sphingobacterium sp. UT-1RO-CII-1]MCY4780936.1 shikimate dehydrogenase [Sphingobacterium sp. UT-1RO-CII-1]
MKKLGLLGYPLGHSFSKKYYLDKFLNENIKDIDYDLYPIPSIEELTSLYTEDERFYGFNVTIPYKQEVIKLLNDISEEAKEIGAVNCITIKRKAGIPFLKGYNTDAYGFEVSLKPLLKKQHKQALILGNGGAAKAVSYTLKKLGIPFKIISRSKQNGDLTYADLNKEVITNHQVIINCSPVGTFPNVDESPTIPYEGIGEQHLLYDLIYNPEETAFLKEGRKRNAVIKNGYEMLVKQADKNWDIWNETV